jgi:hypothetical protein
MDWSLATYRRSLLEAINLLERQLRRSAAALAGYPIAYRQVKRAKELPESERKAFARFQRTERQATRDRQRLEVLRDELVDLDLGRITPRLCERELLAWLNGLRSPKEPVTYRDADPRVFAKKGPRRLDPDLVANIIQARERQRDGRFRDLETLRKVPGVTEELLAGLARTLCRPDEAPDPRPAPLPGIGVMLPARLETRFYPPTPNEPEWRLRLRIIPDEPFIDRHDPRMSEFEAQSVDRLLAALPKGRLLSKSTRDDARCQVLWQQFADLHGGPRAAWLVRQRVAGAGEARRPAPGKRADDSTGEVYYSRLRGLPPVLEVWMARGGADPVPVATLTVSQDPADLVLDIPLGDGEAADLDLERWWSSWEKAVAVGLATEIPLGTGEPTDIDALYVVGLGDADPAPLFEAHGNSGLLGVMARGVPTNTIDGDPAADLAQDAEAWREIAASVEPDAVSRDVSRFLTGSSDALGTVPGTREDARTLGRAMVSALWLPLWGHALKDIWQQGPGVHQAGLWAIQNLLAEGPLPPVRLGDVPYGLLPVTSLALWKPQRRPKGRVSRLSLGDPPFEGRLRESFLGLRQHWAGLAEKGGTVAGADTEKVLTLLGRIASSGHYDHRHATSLEVVRLVLQALGVDLPEADMEAAWRQANSAVAPYLGDPGKEHGLVSIGRPTPMELALVQPPDTPLEDLVSDLRAIALVEDMDVLKEGMYQGSLLTRLAIRARIMSAAEVVLQKRGAPGESLMEPTAPVLGTEPEVLALAHQFDRTMLVDNASPQALLYAGVQDGLRVLADALEGGVPVETVERVMRATLDAAMHRLDPWITGYAWRRLRDLVPRTGAPKKRTAVRRHRVGLYAWVDAPAPGKPGPTEGGLLHAPSDAQATTAVILRDKLLHDPPESRDRWQMDLDSNVIRVAERIAIQVREGMHLWEALGLEVERIVADRDAIQHLRSWFPMRDLYSERRTCNGEAVVEAVREAEDVGEALKIALGPDQEAGLRQLVAAVDAYADLLVAQAVHYVVSGRAGIAGAAMDAAAGLAMPPTLEVLHTPRQGRTIATSVMVALPGPGPTTPTASPGRIAEPAVAAFLESRAFTQAETWTWQFAWGSGKEESAEISLADLGLEPVDTLSLPASKLEAMARARLHRPDADAIEVKQAGCARLQARAHDLVSVLGGQPALPEDWQRGSTGDGSELIQADLVDRYEQLRTAAEAQIADLRTAASSPSRREALHSALRWGVTPLEHDLGPDTEPDERLATLAERAAVALEGRLQAAPSSEDAGSLSPAQLATAIAELASPEGRLAILSHVPLAPVGSGLVADRASGRAGRLDRDWLSVVAAVRPRLAQLEVYQMAAHLGGGRTPLHAWTNRPHDVWQANEPPADDGAGVIPGTRLVVVYGPKGVIRGSGEATVALGLLDRWSETIPDQHHATTAAMGFQAPAARAPQAILLAVPPRLEEALDTKTLVTILEETRALAHARMATQGDLEAARTALPFATFPVLGRLDVLPEEA